MARNLGATPAVVLVLAILGRAVSVANAIPADAAPPASSPIYSPSPLAEQAMRLRTLAATGADYFGAPAYAPSSGESRFERAPRTDNRFFAPGGPPSASLAIGDARATM